MNETSTINDLFSNVFLPYVENTCNDDEIKECVRLLTTGTESQVVRNCFMNEIKQDFVSHIKGFLQHLKEHDNFDGC